ncbi:MAG: hypothetical protein D3904_00730 [Candidatus Electrothrix sp. EH2]|nr:hypothetical protein [Candidatus Electrothrix sp. EH2]
MVKACAIIAPFVGKSKRGKCCSLRINYSLSRAQRIAKDEQFRIKKLLIEKELKVNKKPIPSPNGKKG